MIKKIKHRPKLKIFNHIFKIILANTFKITYNIKQLVFVFQTDNNKIKEIILHKGYTYESNNKMF